MSFDLALPYPLSMLLSVSKLDRTTHRKTEKEITLLTGEWGGRSQIIWERESLQIIQYSLGEGFIRFVYVLCEYVCIFCCKNKIKSVFCFVLLRSVYSTIFHLRQIFCQEKKISIISISYSTVIGYNGK